VYGPALSSLKERLLAMVGFSAQQKVALCQRKQQFSIYTVTLLLAKGYHLLLI
jgi:hypothetical protein